MRTMFFVLGFLFLLNLHGQKLVKKAFVNSRTTSIQINSQYCYQVGLGTAKTNDVSVEAEIEGEYSKDLLITIEEKGTTVLISTGFQPNFINPNDKLSAHKVISIRLNITLPEYKKVFVYGTNSNVLVEGKYKNLQVKLSDGRCILDNAIERIEVTTQKGDILLMTEKGNVIAESVYGKIEKETIPKGQNQYILKTVEGNIDLRKTK
ncbi:hypothetical protein [Flagellimonas sp. CMM7]|uniref:hypothetical protein n=1 Tax=Flagellimonas sp. CMM7 TaxID=2654676 RepID=UPI0013D3ACDF|nr:hypothetical protein [Flagellimonas sp. CMM7]UII81829.1 hypothetical protein LV704_10000 [Flagellimonas sp. CMM7]